VFRYYVSMLLLVLAQAALAADGPVIVPAPKTISVVGSAQELPGGQVAIVVGSKATEPEQYAAERLQKWVTKRFGVVWPIVRDSGDIKPYAALVILGQKATNKLIAPSCADLKMNPEEKYPIQDGYALGVGKSGGRLVAVVAGSNPRSVIFGQDTLFQLIVKQGDKLKLWPAKIKDWPSLKWRGRVCSSPEYWHKEDVLDAAAMGRINYIDVRYGNYGTPPDQKLDKDTIKWVIKEAHRRGLIVYGTFSIVVQKPDYDKAIAKCQEFIDLGVDGIWPYLGDPGGEGRSGTPLDLLAQIIELGKKHGMTGDLIHYTPGKRGYITINTKDNIDAAKVPGLDEALWFFAVKPTAESCADAAKLGLKKKYMWWNHWPHARGGFTSCGNVSMRADGKSRVYADITPFSDAYQSPTPQELAKVPQFVEGGTCWAGSVWLQETVICPWGWYGWSGESYDPELTRHRLYDYIYGPELVDVAFEFNNTLEQLKSKIIRCGDETGKEGYTWPPMLYHEEDRPVCRELIDKLVGPLTKLEQGASRGSLLDGETLQTYFFEPIHAEIAAGRILIELPHPEYWWESNQARIRMALREGNCAQALRWQADAEQHVKSDAQQIMQKLANVINVGDYESDWTSRFEKLQGDATYTSSPITLDGELTEPVWATAQKLGPFRICNDAETTETPSTAQVLYSDDAIYVGLVFGEPDMDLVMATQTQHDSNVWEDDSFEILINTDGLGRPYFAFGANTLGTMFESLHPAGESDQLTWNGAWEVKIAKKADQWSAEARIPYSTLGVTKPVKDTIWLCNFVRHERASHDRITRTPNWARLSTWGYQPRSGQLNPSQFRPLWFK
jgi:hypothetical protein